MRYVGWISCTFLPCFKDFSPVNLVFLPSQKSTFKNSKSVSGGSSGGVGRRRVGQGTGDPLFWKKKKENRKRKKGRQTRKNKPNPPLAQGLLPPLGQHRGPEWKPIKADEASSPNIVFYCVFSYLLMYFLRKWMQFISPVSPIRNIVTSTGQLTALLNTSIMLWILFRNTIFQISLSGISRSKI